MRGVIYLVSIERNALLTRGSGVIVETKRYVRGLRRTPVRVFLPEAGKEPKTAPKPQPAQGNVMRERTVEAAFTSTAERIEDGVFVKARINERSATKQSAVLPDHVDGLRFERAFPGDKRLA